MPGIVAIIGILLTAVAYSIYAGWEWYKGNHYDGYEHDEFGKACFTFWDMVGIYPDDDRY